MRTTVGITLGGHVRHTDGFHCGNPQRLLAWAAVVFLAAAGLTAGCDGSGGANGTLAAAPMSPEPTVVSASPSAAPPTSPASTGASAIPAGALLTVGDVGAGSTMGDVFAEPYSPNPFAMCGIDGFPHASDLVAALGTGIRRASAYSMVGDSVLAFRPGAAHEVMTGIEDLLTGVCRGHFTVVGRDLGGEESLLLRGEDAEPGNAGGRRIGYHAIVRRGDRIAWVEVVDFATRVDFAAYARTLGSRAAQRMCAPATC
jgi:hypothetical protein